MNAVGIRNSPAKVRLLSRGVATEERMAPAGLAWDCIRHVDLVERARTGERGDALRASLYWRYLRTAAGHSEESADRRCERFAALVDAIANEGYDDRDPIAITDDWMRLDGSHRSAVASALGVESVAVRVYRWRDVLSSWRARPMTEEARVKRAAQEAALDREALDATGATLGRVAFVDADLPPRPLLALGMRGRAAYVVEAPDGTLRRHPAAGLAIR